MTRVLVEKDGKVLYDKSFPDDNVSLSSHRDITALYKIGQQEPYILAPSRFIQDVILCTHATSVNAEISTDSKKFFVEV
jgi:hypothetical protein